MSFILSGSNRHVILTKKYVYPTPINIYPRIYRSNNINIYPNAIRVLCGILFQILSGCYPFLILSGSNRHIIVKEKYVYPGPIRF